MKNWEKNIRRVEPYVPGEQPKNVKDIIKLNTNENPYPPAPAVIEEAAKMDMNPLRLYPDANSVSLVDALAKSYSVNPEQIFVGVGSDDVISMIFLTCFNSDKPILFPDITYSFYSVWAEVYRIPYKKLALDENFQINTQDYYEPNGGIIIANPNAPTSIYMDLDSIEDIICHNQDSIVVVDEAYIDFGGESALSLVDKYDNLIVVRTFSKSRSLAGLRIGFAISNKDIIKAISDVKYSINSYTLNMPSIRLGTVAVESEQYYAEITKKVIATRERTAIELEKLGFESCKSSTNFLFTKHNSVPAAWLFEELKKAGIYVRHFNGARIDNYLRITIGTDEQMDRLIKVMSDCIKRY